MKKKKYPVILLSSLIISSGIGQVNTVNAIGPSPAFQKESDKDISKYNNEVLSQVDKEYKILEYNINNGKGDFPLTKVLNTNYKDKNYPSEKESQEGLNEKQQIQINSYKKPITENSRIELAQAVRYYQFFFSDDTKFVPLKDDTIYRVTSNKNGTVENRENLNYFDYSKLINSIKDNPSYTIKERDEKLLEIEKDLDNSIKSLYGDLQVNADFSNKLVAWGNVKSVTIPFTIKKFSYLQLLAAYEKEEAIVDVLSYYSTLLDSLEEMKNYSISIRQNKTKTINTKKDSEKITLAYQKVQNSLINPVKAIISKDIVDKEKSAQAKKIAEEDIKKISGGND
jgi:hypothetical protein